MIPQHLTGSARQRAMKTALADAALINRGTRRRIIKALNGTRPDQRVQALRNARIASRQRVALIARTQKRRIGGVIRSVLRRDEGYKYVLIEDGTTHDAGLRCCEWEHLDCGAIRCPSYRAPELLSQGGEVVQGEGPVASYRYRRLTWRNNITPQKVLRGWSPRAANAAIQEFGNKELPRKWYTKIRRDTGYSGRAWHVRLRGALGRFTKLTGEAIAELYGAAYVPRIRSRGTTGPRALSAIWEGI